MSTFRPLSRRRFLSASAAGAGALMLTGYGHSLLPQRLQATWTQLDAFSAAPDARLHAGMVYDSNQNRLLLFGGSTPGGFRNDVWAYSFDDNAWMELTSKTQGPAPHRLPSLAYDQASHQLLVNHEGIWRFNLKTHQWSNTSDYTDAHTVWVSEENTTFGLAGIPKEQFESMFAFDAQSHQWLAVNQANRVGPRRSGTLAYAPEHDAALLFGGTDTKNDVLVYANHHWTALTHNIDGPASRQRHAVAWVPGRGMAMFGGLTDTVQNDLWLLEVA